jgi:hypothetical protein
MPAQTSHRYREHHPHDISCVYIHIIITSTHARAHARTHADTASHMHNFSSYSHAHTNTHTHTQVHSITVNTHMHERKYASSHAYRRETPSNGRVIVARTLAGGKGRNRQIHSARRQTTIPSGLGYRRHNAAYEIDGGIVTTTCLQGTGPAASAPHTRNNRLGLSVCTCLWFSTGCMTCTCSSRRHPTPFRAIPGAVPNVKHVCNTHLTLRSTRNAHTDQTDQPL